MSNWTFFDDISGPEFGSCRNQDFWDEHEAAIRAYFRNHPEVGMVFAENIVYVKKDMKLMFLLRFGP